MTYSQAIKEDLRPFPVTDAMIQRKCEKHSITPSESASDEATILLIEIELLSQVISLSSVSEGGASKSFNLDAATMQIKRLCTEAGVDVSNYIKIASVTYREDLS